MAGLALTNLGSHMRSGSGSMPSPMSLSDICKQATLQVMMHIGVPQTLRPHLQNFV